MEGIRNCPSAVRFVRRLLVGIILLYMATSLSLGGQPCARPVFQFAAVCWTALSWYFRDLVFRSKPFRIAETSLTNIALALAAAEIALRSWAMLTGASPFVTAALEGYRLTPGRDYGAGLRGNALGYPGRDFEPNKQPGIRRIAALGDSFAIGPTVPYSDNYLNLLERKLAGVEVYNFGVSGTGPREYRAILERDVWPFQPDLVLVSIFVGNDITETLAMPRYMDPRCHAVYLLATRCARLIQEQWRRADEPGEVAPVRRLESALSQETFDEIEARRLAVCRRDSSVPEKKWNAAFRQLEKIIAACKHRGIPVAFVLIPDEFQVNQAVLGRALAMAGLRLCDVDLALPQRRLADFLAQRGVPCLDLLPNFEGRSDAYTPHDTHWNVFGNRIAAARIAPWLPHTWTMMSADSR